MNTLRIGKAVKFLVVSGAMLGLLSACGGGGSTSTPNTTPSIKSLSYSTLAAGSPDSTVTITGSDFITSSEAIVGTTPVTTTYVSSSEITAVLPASDLSSPTTLQIAVNNQGPGGGTSATVPLKVVPVASVVILAAPQNASQPSGTWLITAAAVDESGNPIAGLPVVFKAQIGTVAEQSAQTSSIGVVSATLTPPSGSTTETDTLSATIGSQTAVAIASFAPATSVAAQLRRPLIHVKTLSGTQPLYVSYGSMGSSNSVGTANSFTNLSASDQQCIASSVTITSQCSQTLSSQGYTQTMSDISAETCTDAKTIEQLTGIVSCIGAVGIPLGCVAVGAITGGAGGAVCAVAFYDPEIFLATTCAGFLAVTAAQMVLGAEGSKAADYAQYGLPTSVQSATSAAVDLICNIINPPVTLSSECGGAW